jgi:TolB-like protein
MSPHVGKDWRSRAEWWSPARSGTTCTANPSLTFTSLGEPQLKNIARPVRACGLHDERAPARGAPAGGETRPAIAVLPFDNLGSDPDQAYLSDGISEDLITALSRFRDLRVLARYSSFALRGQALDAIEIGRRLGVGYLLEGSVRKSGRHVRVTAQLIDALAGDQLWAERYDRSLDDIFALQDELVTTIALTLVDRIHAAGIEPSRKKPTAELAAYDCLLRGMDRLAFYDEGTNACLALSIFSEPWGDAAAKRQATCLRLASRAVQLDLTDSRCQRILAIVLLIARDFHRAERSVALNPDNADTAGYHTYVLSLSVGPKRRSPRYTGRWRSIRSHLASGVS